MFFPPIPLIRKKRIIKLLKEAHAISYDSAKRLDEIGLINPNGFSHITRKMVEKNIIRKTDDERYYIERGK